MLADSAKELEALLPQQVSKYRDCTNIIFQINAAKSALAQEGPQSMQAFDRTVDRVSALFDFMASALQLSQTKAIHQSVADAAKQTSEQKTRVARSSARLVLVLLLPS
jgi:hypothetical protein